MNSLKVLIIDDDEISHKILTSILCDTFSLDHLYSGKGILDYCTEHSPDLILLDMGLDEISGLDVIKLLHNNQDTSSIPIIIITANHDIHLEESALELGATDYIRKPFSHQIVKKRLENIVNARRYLETLKSELHNKETKIHTIEDSTIDILASIIEYRSVEVGGHTKRIRLLTEVIIDCINKNMTKAFNTYFDNKTKKLISHAATLHDIGKINIPDYILLKPGKLTFDEYEIMKTHSMVGANIIDKLKDVYDDSYLSCLYTICRHHHERWDGTGYPNHLAKYEIPLIAQIVSLADVYDALSSKRVYKDALLPNEVDEVIVSEENKMFSPLMIECYQLCKERMAQVISDYQ